MIVRFFIVPTEVEFTDLIQWEGIDIAARIHFQIGRGYEDVVHIQQQSTASALRDLTQEICL